MINRQKILYYLQPVAEIYALLFVLFSGIAGFSQFFLMVGTGGMFGGLVGLFSAVVSVLFVIVLLGAVYKLIAIDERLAVIEQRLAPAQD
jgi:hypothetical protein